MTEKYTNNKNVVALGKFDGLHVGHQKLLAAAIDTARQTGGVPIILFIGTPLSYLMTPSEAENKAKELGIEKCVRYELTEEFRNMSGEDFVGKILFEELKCCHVVVGYNFRFSKNRSCSSEDLVRICNEYGMKCTVIDEISVTESDGNVYSVSSSRIKELLMLGKVCEADKYLGHRYTLKGVVSHGKHLGTELGFPTANIIPENGRQLPGHGVYATAVMTDNCFYSGVTNVGTNPTVNSADNITIETHINDFSQDIYGKEISVCFIDKIRDEKKFSNVAELTSQIEKDCYASKQIFLKHFPKK